MILLDFSKAFDKVPHERLKYKLQYYGIRESLHSWISDFLAKRKQQVVLDGHTSTSAPVSSGLPQGSVLGPLLFLIFINDLPEYVSSDCTTRLFADDCVIYRRIKSHKDAVKLQSDLNGLLRWENDWMMQFHPTKCQVILITNKRYPVKTNI